MEKKKEKKYNVTKKTREKKHTLNMQHADAELIDRK